MSQEKAAEIIDLAASRDAAQTLSGDERAGEFLANARRRSGLVIEDISAATNVKIEHITAIEEMRADLLPATPYAVGFVKVYAQYLGLDADAIADRFKEDIKAVAPATIESRDHETHDNAVVGEGVRMASIIGIIAVAIFAVWIGFQIAGGNETQQREATSVPAPRVRLGDAPAPRPVLRTPAATIKQEPAAPPRDTRVEETQAPPESVTPNVDAVEVNTVAPPADDRVIEEAAIEPAPVQSPNEPAPETPTDLTAVSEPLETLIEPTPETAIPEVGQSEEIEILAQPVRTASPEYPARCDEGAASLETVTVMFDVTAAGRPANLRVASSTNACFESEAVRTIGRWRFNPRTVDSAPRPDLGKKATVNFRR